jgi:hypothetical protein
MKTHFALGVGLLLTLGSAVAGSVIYGQGQAASQSASLEVEPVRVPAAQLQPTPELIALWKATSASPDYAAPKTPL